MLISTTTLDLQILGAAFGMADVTSNIKSLVNRSAEPQSLSVEANINVLLDGWPGVVKTLVVVYRYGEKGLVKIAIAKENTTLHISGDGYEELQPIIPGNPNFSVLAAAYGPRDVTSEVNSLINRSTGFTPNNDTFGDSWVNVRKSFVIVTKANRTSSISMNVVPEDQPYSLMDPPPLKILSAYYGMKSVLPVIENAISHRAINIEARNNIFGDTWPGVLKILSIVYQYGNQTPQLAAVVEGGSLKIGYDPTIGQYDILMNPLTLNIIGAVYGPSNVTSAVNAIKGPKNHLEFVANNATFGDSLPGHLKSFSITYSWGPLPPKSLIVKEGDVVSLALPGYHLWHNSE